MTKPHAALTQPTVTSPRAGHKDSRGVTPSRLALSRDEAAAAIGVSLDSFERYVQPELRLVYLGRRRLVPVKELERFLERNAARMLE
jgi:hypothetical protein